MTDAIAGVDRSTLLAERAEAEAQLRAAEATLGITAPAANGRPGSKEADQAAQTSSAVEAEVVEAAVVDASDAETGPELDIAELRRAAALARAADDVLARAASEAADRPPGEGELGSAETAFARAAAIQEDLPAAWRRLVGALISATGMAIVIGALGWNTYWLLVPIALIAIMTVDLRVAGKAAREASAEAARELASVGVAASDGLERLRTARARVEDAESRLASARVSRDAAYARFEELAPGRTPSELEEIIAEHEAEQVARAEAARAKAKADAARAAEAARTEAARAEAARAEADSKRAAEAEAARPPQAAPPQGEAARPTEGRESVPAEPPPPVAAAAEWWFGSREGAQAEPAPEAAAAAEPPAPVRALAERLSAEGRAALARIEAQLAALDRLELAKRSLEWHESQAVGEKPESPSPTEAEDAET